MAAAMIVDGGKNTVLDPAQGKGKQGSYTKESGDKNPRRVQDPGQTGSTRPTGGLDGHDREN